MNEIYDIVVVAVVILSLIAFVSTWHLEPNERYIINLEYYTLESLLNYELSDAPVYEHIMEHDLNKHQIKSVLDRVVPKGYNYLFEIPEYNFRVTNVPGANDIETCIQLNKIYPVNYNFNGVHLILGIWNGKYRVIKCVG